MGRKGKRNFLINFKYFRVIREKSWKRYKKYHGLLKKNKDYEVVIIALKNQNYDVVEVFKLLFNREIVNTLIIYDKELLEGDNDKKLLL